MNDELIMCECEDDEPFPAAVNYEPYTNKWIEARLRELLWGDSNDEEIDTLREIVEHLWFERIAHLLQGSYLLAAVAAAVAERLDDDMFEQAKRAPEAVVRAFIDRCETDGGTFWEAHIQPMLDAATDDFLAALASGEIEATSVAVEDVRESELKPDEEA